MVRSGRKGHRIEKCMLRSILLRWLIGINGLRKSWSTLGFGRFSDFCHHIFKTLLAHQRRRLAQDRASMQLTEDVVLTLQSIGIPERRRVEAFRLHISACQAWCIFPE